MIDYCSGWQQQASRKGLGQASWAGPQQQHFQQKALSTKQGGWTIAHQHHPTQGPRGWATQAPAPAGTQRGQPTSNVSTNRAQVQAASRAAAPGPRVAAPAPSGPAPGSWAAKINTQKAAAAPGPRALTQPPPPSPMQSKRPTVTVPPSPSSDWRQHTMSPSPRTGGKVMESWPGLGDFPAPPSMGNRKVAPKAAPKAAQPLQGAWGKKR